jgi:hypothetical protein
VVANSGHVTVLQQDDTPTDTAGPAVSVQYKHVRNPGNGTHSPLEEAGETVAKEKSCIAT